MYVAKHSNQFNIYLGVLIAGFIIIIASCAKIVPPSGGAKDLAPPKLIASIPDSPAINFTKNEVLLEFDEYIKLSDMRNQFLVSPPLNEFPDVVVVGKKVKIKILDTLKSNTTYTLNFNSALKDFTNNNVYKDFSFNFSTGNVIDSAFLTGVVIDAFTLEPVKNVLVGVYPNLDTNALYKKPLYCAKTNDKGIYKIKNIPIGKYFITAFDDINYNYLYEKYQETIGFIVKHSTSTIQVIDTSMIIDTMAVNKHIDTIFVFKEEKSGNGIKSLNWKNYYHFTIELKKQSDTLYIIPTHNQLLKHIIKSKHNDTIQCYVVDSINNDFKIVIKDNTGWIDTISPYIQKQVFQEKNKKKTHPIIKKINAIQPPYTNMIFKSSLPIDTLYNNKVLFISDSDTIATPKLSISESKTNLIISKEYYKENTKYNIVFLPLSIHDIYGNYNVDTINIIYSTKPLDYYGQLVIELKKVSDKIIFQLLNPKGQVYSQTYYSSDTIITYPYMEQGNYKVRIIHDNDGNRQYTNGNYTLLQLPEKIQYSETPITIKTNWETIQEFIVK